MGSRSEWEREQGASPGRLDAFETMSGVALDGVYGPDEGEFPGQWPYTRGPYASMYRFKRWTMRQFAGFGTAEETNLRFHELLRSGGDGLSTAFDMPTLMGRDSDDPLALGEVGRGGVAVDTAEDMKTLFDGIDLGSVSTSMTVNGPAAVILAMFVVAADEGGVERRLLSGTLQNDILKEYQAQKEYIHPPRPSLRLVTDSIAYCSVELPRIHPVSISGYHIREAGSTAAQELAFTLANGIAYVEAAIGAGLDVDTFAPRLSFFFNAQIDFFEEIAKYRAARRIWARWLRDHFGARDERSTRLRFHTQTSGVSLAAQQPEVNLSRVAIEALAAVLGGTQSLHTDAYDEALALPTEKAARLALRTQQVIAEETGVPAVADPLGGSYLVESLTDELEARAESVFSHLRTLGRGSMLDGVVEAIETGWFQGEIADSAYRLQRKLESGERVMVGVNRYREGTGEDPPRTFQVDPAVEGHQLQRLAEVRRARNPVAVREELARLRTDAADPGVNVMPALLAAARVRATLGEMVGTMADVFGRWRERSHV